MTQTDKKPPMDLWDFSVIATHGVWKPVPHINLIYEILHYALNGQVENFCCALSPRLGKSTAISELFPAYLLGTRPYSKIILTAYSAELARGFGEKAKINFEQWGHLFKGNPQLSESTKSKYWFKVKNKTGEFFCSGLGGGVLGRGANWLIIDDPSKNILEARSKTHQEKLISHFNTTLRTRREKDPVTGQNPVTIVIHQRLDQQDLIGQIIEKNKDNLITADQALPLLRKGESLGSTWLYLQIPEIARENDILGRKPGQALWPEKRNEEDLAQLQREVGRYEFSAVYLQDPKKREGNIFKASWFFDEDTGNLNPQLLVGNNYLHDHNPQLRYWDFAASGEDGDELAAVKTAFVNDRMIVLDLVNGKFTANQSLARFNKTIEQDGQRCKVRIEQEPGSMSKMLIRKLQTQYPKHVIRADKVKTNKADRSFDLEILAETGRLLFNIDTMRLRDIEKACDELVAFTGKPGGIDNITDTLTGSARYWMKPKTRINVN